MLIVEQTPCVSVLKIDSIRDQKHKKISKIIRLKSHFLSDGCKPQVKVLKRFIGNISFPVDSIRI